MIMAKTKELEHLESVDESTDRSYDRWVTVDRAAAERMVEEENARLLAEGKKPVKKVYRFALGPRIESRRGDIRATVQYEAGSARILWCAANNNYHADWLFNAHLGHQASSKENVRMSSLLNDLMALEPDERKEVLQLLAKSDKKERNLP
jgi:hypothetical protein